MSVSNFVRSTVIDRIEDLVDLREIETYEKNRTQEANETISLDDVKKQLSL